MLAICRYLPAAVKSRPLARLRNNLRAGARNALELARLGRLAEASGAPFDIVFRGEHHRLRRYASTEASGSPESADAPAIVLVPPLMLTAEVYDVAPEISAVSKLVAEGIQPFVVDFGAPEREQGGMRRTLDDHVRAVVESVQQARELTGRDVHLCGYSQGGMFAYQAAAYLHGKGIRSVITFGSPVDIHRNLPAISNDVARALARFLEPSILPIIERIEGLPGVLTSTGFKLLSPRKEIEQRLDFVRKLHDRNALVRRESRRRFLGGEGFVAWPGPALRAFVEDFVVHNRMLSGGFIINGRTVSLADIRCPILAFVGDTDDFARPATVRAIAEAAPEADVEFARLKAGHFGLVVGSRAMSSTWPTVASWIHYQEGKGPRPIALQKKAEIKLDDEMEAGSFDIELELFLDTVVSAARSSWRRMGDLVASTSDAVDAIRYQEPRLRKLAHIGDDDILNPAQALADQAKATPEATFFLWQGRAFSYRDADVRITNVAKGLWSRGVRPGDRVGIVMGSRPSFLSVVTALSRIGAVAVIAPPDADPKELRRALEAAEVRFIVADPELGSMVHEALGREILVLGGGGSSRIFGQGLFDMETIDLKAIHLPQDFIPNPGKARDLSMILLRPSGSSELRHARITNHRWALSAYGAAAACTLKPSDTVYSCIPLHHPTGVVVTVGAALIGGSRLALGEPFSPASFFADIRRTGATVVFYAGEMLRPLLEVKPSRGDRTLPIRLFAGSGMRPYLAARLNERFGIGVMEFYAGTTQKLILANASGEKPGALGRPLPGSSPIAVVRCDWRELRPMRCEKGYFIEAVRGEAGILVAKVSGEIDALEGVVEDAFEPRDRWFITHDVVKEDEDGDYWFVDSLTGFVRTKAGPVSTRKVEEALYTIPQVQIAAAWGEPEGEDESEAVVAAIVLREAVDDKRLSHALSRLEAHERPVRIERLGDIPLTDGFRPNKAELQRAAKEIKGAARRV